MRDRDGCAAPVRRGPAQYVDTRERRAGHDRLGRLEPRWTPMRLEEPRPAPFDLGRRHPLPRAGVGFTQAFVVDHLGRSEFAGDDRRCLGRPRQVARSDDRELRVDVGRERASDRRRLAPTEVGERRIGEALPALHSVPFALAMPDEQQRTLPRVHPERGYRCRYAATCGNRAVLRVRPPDRWHRAGRASRTHRRRGARCRSGAIRRSVWRRARNLPHLGERGVGRRSDDHRR